EGGSPDADEQEQPAEDDVDREGAGKRQRGLPVRRVALPVFLFRRHAQGRARTCRFSLRRHGTPSSRTRPTSDYPTAPVVDKHEKEGRGARESLDGALAPNRCSLASGPWPLAPGPSPGGKIGKMEYCGGRRYSAHADAGRLRGSVREGTHAEGLCQPQGVP